MGWVLRGIIAVLDIAGHVVEDWRDLANSARSTKIRSIGKCRHDTDPSFNVHIRLNPKIEI